MVAYQRPNLTELPAAITKEAAALSPSFRHHHQQPFSPQLPQKRGNEGCSDYTSRTHRQTRKKPSIITIRGFFKCFGGQSRNRTTDTRIFKTNHSTGIDPLNSKNCNKFPDLPADRRTTTEPPTELFWLIGRCLAVLSNSINGMRRGSPTRCRYCIWCPVLLLPFPFPAKTRQCPNGLKADVQCQWHFSWFAGLASSFSTVRKFTDLEFPFSDNEFSE